MDYNFTFTRDDGTWTVQVDPSALYGCFERDSDGTCGGLWFRKAHLSGKPIIKLIDYDGVVVLPKAVTAILRDAGYIVSKDFE